VEDLEPVYDRCAFAIAPVYSGGGTNIKVVEALAHRRTCVITSYSLAAFTPMLKDGTDIVSAKDDEGMAVTCVRFLRDQEFRNRVAEQGYMTVLSRFSPSVFSAAVARAAALAISQHARAINAWGRPCRLRAHR
jgi:glycosyltransferase involved in cell wall biosynthesis